MTALLKAGLYQEEGTAAAPAHPALLGGACASCGYVFFPFQNYGCEKCGSSNVAPRTLSGSGRLIASARVHLHAGKGREAPFTVGAIALDDGPIVRTLITESQAPLQVGQRMVAMLADVANAEGEPRRDLRFVSEVSP